MWRHLLTYAGGQGIVVIALTFLFKGTAGAYKVYVGEGKDERLLPNVVQTARAIWLVSLTWLVLGTLGAVGHRSCLGQDAVRAFLHGLWVFMGAWSTGGFAPQSYNTFYYHALSYEIICIVIMIAGSFNFALHWAVWTGNARRSSATSRRFASRSRFAHRADRDVRARQGGVYPDAMSLFRKSSTSSPRVTRPPASRRSTRAPSSRSGARSGCWPPRSPWPSAPRPAPPAAASRASAWASCSRRSSRHPQLVSPECAVSARFHHIRDMWLDDGMVRTAMTITIAYLTLYALGRSSAALRLRLHPGAFEVVSAASNTGLSCGVTSPRCPI